MSTEFTVSPLSTFDVEKKALFILAIHTVFYGADSISSDCKVVDIEDIADRELYDLCGYKLCFSPRQDFSLQELGKTNFLEKIVYLRQEEFALDMPSPRARFTMAHEAAHVFLHSSQLEDEKKIAARLEAGPPGKLYLSAEWQANKMAAAMLIPFPALLDEVENTGYGNCNNLVRNIASRFNVSLECASKRLETLGSFTKDQHQKLLIYAKRMRQILLQKKLSH